MNPEEFEDFKRRFGEEFADSADDILEPLNAWRDWPWGKQYNFWATDYKQCPRRMFLTMWSIPKSNPEMADKTITRFSIGDKVEETVVEKYRQMRGNVWTQVGGAFEIPGCEDDIQYATDVYDNVVHMFAPRVTYKLDVVFDDLSKMFDDKVHRYVVEVKSFKQWPWTSSTKKGESEPYFYGAVDVTPEDYYTQLCQYLYYERVADGLLHFVNCNDGAEKVWYVDIERAEPAVENEVLPRFRSFYSNYVHRELPERPYEVTLSKDGSRILKTGSDWHCQYCPYSSMCWGLDGHEPLDGAEQLFEKEER